MNQARQAYHGRRYTNEAWFIVAEYARLMHLKEIGHQADFSTMDEFTMSCFMVVAETFHKCRQDEMKKREKEAELKRRRR